MIYQKTDHSCGPAAVANALRLIGIKVSESKAAKYTATTEEEGTDSPGIVEAINSLGGDALSFDEKSFDVATTPFIRDNHPIIIAINDWSHWTVLAAGTGFTWGVGGNYLIIDSSRTAKNRAVNGVHVITEKQLKKIWRHSNGYYSGVVVRSR